MSEIRIVEFEQQWAQAIAEMWNDSQDNWGGGSSVMTEAEVLHQENNSSNLNLYIAIDGEKVVGYCSLSELKGDEGALYIPLLNVRPDYHGKKIGKMLVLKALERTIELGWPRLDLHTWPGNTKAVPLYKKCGFFWEERDDTTHLMNFIPTVLDTEMLKDYFAETNWYEQSMRQIEVKPDGRNDNGFDYYAYSWENHQGKKARVEFERKGRGIRLIETDEFLLSASVENFKLISGGSYEVQYEMINKTGTALEVDLKGIDDKNIMFSPFNQSLSVSDRENVKGTFTVGAINEKQSPYKAHPAVTTEIRINGKRALFKTGIYPDFAVDVSLSVPDNLTYLNTSSQMFLNIENSVKEPVALEFDFPEHEWLRVQENHKEIHLKEEGKVSIPVSYELSQHGFYNPEIHFKLISDSGKDLSFSKMVTAAFKGFGEKFHGESDQYWHIYNGMYHVLLNKDDNLLFPGKEKEGEGPSFIFYPKLGKPFSDEFSRIKPESVTFNENQGDVELKATYLSKAFPSLALTSNVKLYGEGLVEQWFEIENRSSELFHDVWLYNWIRHEFNRPVFSYENEILEVDDPIDHYVAYWESEKVTENWMFSRDEHYGPLGLCWSKEDRIHFEEWFVFFEKNFDIVPSGTKVSTQPIFMSIGAFQNWKDFRSFSLKKHGLDHSIPSSDVKISVNGHNPITQNHLIVNLIEHKATYLDGEVTLSIDGHKVEEKTIHKKNKLRNIQFQEVDLSTTGIHLLNLQGHLTPRDLQKSSVVLRSSSSDIQMNEVERNGLQTFEADNGPISIKASAEYFPVLYSIEVKGQEWLDHAFPETIAKSWWNPWSGGIGSRFSDLNDNSLAKEHHAVRFDKRVDQHGNEWSGIAFETVIRQHDDYKDLTFTQYFLMLPGVPAVCMVTQMNQHTGMFLHNKQWHTNCFLNGELMTTITDEGKAFTYKNRSGEIEGSVHQDLVYSFANQQEKLQVAADFETDLTQFYSNKEVHGFTHIQRMNLPNGSLIDTKPIFFLFSEQEILAAALRDLKNTRFS